MIESMLCFACIEQEWKYAHTCSKHSTAAILHVCSTGCFQFSKESQTLHFISTQQVHAGAKCSFYVWRCSPLLHWHANCFCVEQKLWIQILHCVHSKSKYCLIINYCISAMHATNSDALCMQETSCGTCSKACQACITWPCKKIWASLIWTRLIWIRRTFNTLLNSMDDWQLGYWSWPGQWLEPSCCCSSSSASRMIWLLHLTRALVDAAQPPFLFLYYMPYGMQVVTSVKLLTLSPGPNALRFDRP